MKIQNIIGATLTGISIVWPMFLVVNTENYLWFAPYIQTQFTKDFNLKQYEQIQPGTTREEVVTKIGKPLDFPDEFDPYVEANCERYTDDGGGFAPWDLGWVSLSVCYDDEGKVEKITKRIYRD